MRCLNESGNRHTLSLSFGKYRGDPRQYGHPLPPNNFNNGRQRKTPANSVNVHNDPTLRLRSLQADQPRTPDGD